MIVPQPEVTIGREATGGERDTWQVSKLWALPAQAENKQSRSDRQQLERAELATRENGAERYPAKSRGTYVGLLPHKRNERVGQTCHRIMGRASAV